MNKNSPSLRLTGIEAIGPVPWGTHICQFFKTKNDLLDILVPFFKAGLENNESCIWIISRPMVAEDAVTAMSKAMEDIQGKMAKGQFIVCDYKATYLRTGSFNVADMIKNMTYLEQAAITQGFDGLRISGNTSWMRMKDWDNFLDYELVSGLLIRRHKIIALCSYSLNQLDPVKTTEVVSRHQQILVRHDGNWKLIYNTGQGHIINMRNSGINYAEIARKLGVSRQWISSLANMTKRNSETDFPEHSDNKVLLTSKEAAAFLGIHINTIRRWGDNGVLPSHRVGKRKDRRFTRSDLEKLVGNSSLPSS